MSARSKMLVLGLLSITPTKLWCASADEWKLADPTVLAGKQITSLVSLKREPAAASTDGSSGRVVVGGPSEQTVSRMLLVKKSTSTSLVLEQTVKRVQMTIESPLGKSVYDSDNAFERDQITSGLSQRYDPYINKVHKSDYTTTPAQPKQPTSDEGFESVWTLNLPTLIGVPSLQGMFISRLPLSATVGAGWVDTIRSEKGTTVNKYQVLNAQGDLLKLKLASELLPGAQPRVVASSKGNSPVTSTIKTLTYTGEVNIRRATGFIEELHLTKNSSASINAAGKTLQNTSVAIVELHNTLK